MDFQKRRAARIGWGLAVLAAMSLAVPVSAAPVVFSASGIFTDGSLLTGTLTIDTTLGVATGSAIQITAPIAFDAVVIQPNFYSLTGTTFIELGATTLGYPYLMLLIHASTLVGYTGGSLCSNVDSSCDWNPSSWETGTDFVSLSSGSLTAQSSVAAVPEPGTFGLLALPLLAFALWRRRRAEARLQQTIVPSKGLKTNPDFRGRFRVVAQCLVLVALSYVATPANAAPVTFVASGTFQSGAVLSGSVTIDTATGAATSTALHITAPWNADLLAIQSVFQPAPDVTIIQAGPNATDFPNFVVALHVPTLVGYAGGSICSLTDLACGGISNIHTSNSFDSLQVGSLTAGVPEPGTFGLLGASILTLGFWRRRKGSRLGAVGTRVRNHRSALRLVAACVGLIALSFFARPAAAAPIAFVASGEFQSGALLSGTLTIDTATGEATASTLHVSDPWAVDLTFVQITYLSAPGVTVVQLNHQDASTFPHLILLFGTGSLVGYAGGTICSFSDLSCDGNVSDIQSQFAVEALSFGSLTQADAGVPEPATYALIGSALVLLAGCRRFRRAHCG